MALRMSGPKLVGPASVIPGSINISMTFIDIRAALTKRDTWSDFIVSPQHLLKCVAGPLVRVKGKYRLVLCVAVAKPECRDHLIIVESFQCSTHDGDDMLVWILLGAGIMQTPSTKRLFAGPCVRLSKIYAKDEIARL
eukprot:3171082-Rhodomonas_salina.1